MKTRVTFVTVLLLIAMIPTVAPAAKKKQKKASPHFVYDQADQTIEATMLEGEELYDPSVAATDEGLRMAWLKFTPGKGDEICVSTDSKTGKVVSEKHGRYARPTLTVDTAGKLHLTYEAFDEKNQQWDIFLRPHIGDGKFGAEQQISTGRHNDINHHVAPDPKGGLWVVWQGDRGGKFDILARKVGGKQSADVEEVASGLWSQWRPSIAAGPDGAVTVAWDAYDGESYNVMLRRRVDGKWAPSSAVAAGPAFQGRGQVAAGRDGQTWILWESGCDNWGKPHRGMAFKNSKMSDSYGPLHRFRQLHVGVIDPKGAVRLLAKSLAAPSFVQAANRENSRPDCRKFGVFYERGELGVDPGGRPWVVYRHFYSPQMALAKGMRSHVEAGWRLYARCIDGAEWSKLYAFDIPQRDGLQRLSIAPTKDGLAAIWTTGRTDRRKDPLRRGIATGMLSHPKGKPAAPQLKAAVAVTVKQLPKPSEPKPATVGGKTYKLFYGDLHRHTDLSLCFPFLDGSLEDAYRYAIDVAGLDFLGVTDHTRDINHGNVKSHLWWRCTKEVTRHRLSDKFFPMFTYERSMGETDHNVITLRDDILRDFTYPLVDFWKELDHDSFTVPHAPVHIKTWSHKNDDMRPLIEIYQGYRDYDSKKAAHVGLDKGHHIGFIASSDHVSTSASYACVWAPETNLTSIFRSMQARRTFGATDKIRLVFRSGDHWMGQRFTAKAIPQFQIELDATAPMKSITIYDNGKPAGRIPLKDGQRTISTTYKPADKYFTGKHYIYIHMIQTDGNQAWSSPIWVTYENPVKDPKPKLKPKVSATSAH